MKNGIYENFKRMTNLKLMSSLVALFVCVNANAYVEDHLGTGTHFLYKTYSATKEEAMNICIELAEKHGYDGSVYCGPMGDEGMIWGGWFREQKDGQKEPFHLANAYYEINCPTPLLLTKDQGCITKDQSCPVGNPINTGIGNKVQSENDYVGTGVHPLMVTRTYQSVGNPRDLHWHFMPNLHIAPGVSVVTVRANGRRYRFTSSGDSWLGDPDISATLESITVDSEVVGWRYTTLSQTIEDYDIYGKLASITDRTGAIHSYVHSGSSITVTHSNGDVLIYQRDSGSGLITGFTTPDGETYTYTYNGSKLLSISYPNAGGTRIFHYEDPAHPNALTGITDENSTRFATWAYDSAGRAISSEHNGGTEKVTIDYTNIDDAADPRAVATNVLGKQTTYHFADIFGARKVTQVEGHPSVNCAAANKNYSYDANGFVASKTDWKGNTTTYVRNTKGQELSRTEASGTAEARTITTEWHLTFNLRTKVTEPDRETLYSYDANGNLLSQQTSDLTTP